MLFSVSALLIGVLSCCSSGSSPAVGTWRVPAAGGSHAFDQGLTIDLPTRAVPVGTSIRVSPGPGGASKAAEAWRAAPAGKMLGPGLVTDVVRVDTDTKALTQDATLRLHLTKASAGTTGLFLATFDEAASVWRPVVSEYDPGSNTLIAQTNHFSIWAGFQWAADRVNEVLRNAFRAAFGPGLIKLDPLACTDSADVVLTMTGVGGLDTCKTRAPDGSVTLKLRNAHSYALKLQAAPGTPVTRDTVGSLSQAARDLLGSFVDGPGTTLVPSEAVATVRLPAGAGDEATVITDVDQYSYVLDALSVALETYLITYSTLSSATTAQQATVARLLNTNISLTKCFPNGLDLANNPGLDVQFLARMGKAAFDCVGLAAEAVNTLGDTALVAGVLGIVTSIIRSVVSSVEILKDILTNSVSYWPATTVIMLKAAQQSTTSTTTTTELRRANDSTTSSLRVTTTQTTRLTEVTGTTATTASPVTTTSPPSVHASFQVDSSREPPGLSTGMSVSAGQTLRVLAGGSATYGYDPGPCGDNPVTSPHGYRLYNGQRCEPKMDAGAVAPGEPIGKLLACVASSSGSCAGRWFGASDGLPIKPTTSGQLYLVYNDVPGTYGNNSGVYQVSVDVAG